MSEAAAPSDQSPSKLATIGGAVVDMGRSMLGDGFKSRPKNLPEGGVIEFSMGVAQMLGERWVSPVVGVAGRVDNALLVNVPRYIDNAFISAVNLALPTDNKLQPLPYAPLESDPIYQLSQWEMPRPVDSTAFRNGQALGGVVSLAPYAVAAGLVAVAAAGGTAISAVPAGVVTAIAVSDASGLTELGITGSGQLSNYLSEQYQVVSAERDLNIALSHEKIINYGLAIWRHPAEAAGLPSKLMVAADRMLQAYDAPDLLPAMAEFCKTLAETLKADDKGGAATRQIVLRDILTDINGKPLPPDFPQDKFVALADKFLDAKGKALSGLQSDIKNDQTDMKSGFLSPRAHMDCMNYRTAKLEGKAQETNVTPVAAAGRCPYRKNITFPDKAKLESAITPPPITISALTSIIPAKTGQLAMNH